MVGLIVSTSFVVLTREVEGASLAIVAVTEVESGHIEMCWMMPHTCGTALAPHFRVFMHM